MTVSLNRVILFVHDVNGQKQFYQTVFGLVVSEEIENEWVVFNTGTAELALHKQGPPNDGDSVPKMHNNLKIVFETGADIFTLREDLIRKNIRMRDVKYFDDSYFLCDGEDPEGNVFQLKVKR